MITSLSLNNTFPYRNDTKELLEICTQDTTKPRLIQVVLERILVHLYENGENLPK